ncbi:hypothetical protein C8039_03765 [Halogeometricum sp. wsp3]|nr:hypothetical protein C8039_03765 [Halogeometricum sp. wsp3]
MFEDYKEWGNGIGDPGVGKPASVVCGPTAFGKISAQVSIPISRSRMMANGEGERTTFRTSSHISELLTRLHGLAEQVYALLLRA